MFCMCHFLPITILKMERLICSIIIVRMACIGHGASSHKQRAKNRRALKQGAVQKGRIKYIRNLTHFQKTEGWCIRV